MIMSIFWEGCHGAWGLGRWEKVEECLIFEAFFDIVENIKKMKTITKSVKVAWIELILIQNESPHRVLDSSGGLGKFFEEKGG